MLNSRCWDASRKESRCSLLFSLLHVLKHCPPLVWRIDSIWCEFQRRHITGTERNTGSVSVNVESRAVRQISDLFQHWFSLKCLVRWCRRKSSYQPPLLLFQTECMFLLIWFWREDYDPLALFSSLLVLQIRSKQEHSDGTFSSWDKAEGLRSGRWWCW